MCVIALIALTVGVMWDAPNAADERCSADPCGRAIKLATVVDRRACPDHRGIPHRVRHLQDDDQETARPRLSANDRLLPPPEGRRRSVRISAVNVRSNRSPWMRPGITCAGRFVRVVTRWHDQVMAGEPGLEINVDLFEALVLITGDAPKTPEPIVALSAFLYSLAKGYGLSDSQQLTESQLERADPPAVRDPVDQPLPCRNGAAGIEPEHLRTLLYSTFLELSRDGRARSALNKNSRSARWASSRLRRSSGISRRPRVERRCRSRLDGSRTPQARRFARTSKSRT